MSEDRWAENWVEGVGERKLEEALEKLRRTKGLKKKLLIKAVTQYINSMIGDESE